MFCLRLRMKDNIYCYSNKNEIWTFKKNEIRKNISNSFTKLLME